MQILYAITDSFNCPLHITIFLCIVNQMKPSTTEQVLFFPFHFHISKNDTLFSIYKQTTLYYTTNKLESSFPEFSTSYFHSFHFFFIFVTTLSRVLTRNFVYMSTLYSHLIDTVCVSTLFLCFYSKFHFSIFVLGLKLAIRYHWY